ncbi:MAG TPA: CpsB/CapC family capsule biosynthesis tyrosine phosphatase [Candidatus Acidoferrum sp.]|jgi:protein-tyrosine phosphatase
MVDIHCHILPGLDDGPETLKESLEMAEAAIADGITHVVATPHSSNEFAFDYPRIRELRDEVQEKIGHGLTLATGCDFHLNPENLEALAVDAPRFCINQLNYLLVEFSDYSIPPSMDQTLHELRLAGLRPIITHPERNPILHANPGRLTKWAELGCYIQVTGGSITGGFGKKAQADSLQWISQGLVHFVASDAHNMRQRPLRLQPAFAAVRDQFGEEKARALFTDNPGAAFEGRELPHVPDLAANGKSPHRKRFFFF